MQVLKNKKILYISPKFFGYENVIKEKLESFDVVVDYFDERPSNDFLTKVFIRLKLKFLVNKKINDYYNTIFDYIKDKSYDYIFVVSPETFSFKELKKIKSIQPNAISIIYMWDSFKNKNSFNTIELFDKVFSFDSRDVEKYNLSFLPLFYIEEYEKLESNNYEFDLSFIATAHSDRYKIAKQIYKLLFNHNIFYYFYLPSKIMYFLRKFFIKSYKYGNIKDFNFEPLEHNKIVNLFRKSKVVLDINHPDQYGLTMRTFECLGAKKKLITTNENIIKYDFYNSNNIMIIDRDNIKIEKSFFDLEYQELEKHIYKKYSIENWLNVIFQEKKL